MTSVDIAAGDAVAADNDNAVDAVVPPSSTKDKDAYVGASVAFEGVCVGAFADGAAAADVALSRCCHRRSLHAAATAMPPSRCMAASSAVAAAPSAEAGHSASALIWKPNLVYNARPATMRSALYSSGSKRKRLAR